MRSAGRHPESDASAIAVRELTKTFSATVRRPGVLGAVRSIAAPEREVKTAVDQVTFSVARGELLALLGPNGAGKSTTIKMLTGILTPTQGTVTVAGVVPHRDRQRNARNIGAVFGQRTQLWWDLPARESFAILRSIYDVPHDRHRARLAELDALLELSSFWTTRVRHLSLGQRVRCDLAAALLHDPAIVFLDEPTIGMDVVVKEQVRGMLRHEVERRGRTVLLTTHDMTEVERLAERVVLINHGRIVLDGTLDEVKKRFGTGWRVRVTLAEPMTPDTAVTPGLRVLRQDGALVEFGPDTAEMTMPDTLRLIVDTYRVVDLAIEESDLEDVMRTAYLREQTPLAAQHRP